MIYLSGAIVPGLAEVPDVGYMLTPNMGNKPGLHRIPFGCDTGCFSAAGDRAFDLDRYLTWLDALPREGCLFATAPDVYGDAPATLARSLPVLPQLRALGFPAALVAQDGLTPEATPWGSFDVLFLGGTDNPTPWKLSPAAWALVQAARARGVPTHNGRVNSLRRLIASQVMGCDSADGTYLKYGPDVNLPKLLRWLRTLRAQPVLAGLVP